MTLFILVTGGSVSGLGKGTLVSSLGLLLREAGVSTTAVKIDPYLNHNAGTLSPDEHGECFVLRDGTEADLDLGCYERFLDMELDARSSITGGQVWAEVLKREAAGDFLGQTVQVVPHITDAIQARLHRAANGFSVCLIELGGTVGELEGMPFLEALRELDDDVHHVWHVHVAFVPWMGNELKSKPAQQSLRILMEHGLAPHVVALRAVRGDAQQLDGVAAKIKRATGVERCWYLPQARSVWDVPAQLMAQGVVEDLARAMNRSLLTRPSLSFLRPLSEPRKGPTVCVALVAKYTRNLDSYLSLTRALQHAATSVGIQLKLVWDPYAPEVDAVVVPGGFGERGIDAKIKAAAWAWDNRVPFLGICLGLQLMVTARARACGHVAAHCMEFSPDAQPALTVPVPEEKQAGGHKSGTMRLGDCITNLDAESVLSGGTDTVLSERHRHRYEINPAHKAKWGSWGLWASGVTRVDDQISVMEALPQEAQPFYVGVQFHPEMKSRPREARPCFVGLLKAALETQTLRRV
jgi:CTP synthase